MEDFQKRMLNELEELNSRFLKLYDFIHNNPVYDKLSKEEKLFQAKQLSGMDLYRDALIARLGYYGIIDGEIMEKLGDILADKSIYPERFGDSYKIMASELARKLNAAVEANGDHPVINSLTLPVSSGKPFSAVIYHKGDDHFELE